MTDRFRRQSLFAGLGTDGQALLRKARVAIVGVGALGTHSAQWMARAGVAFLRLCDRDFVELDNLPRQVLFDEADARDRLPKAAAAAEKLRRIDSALAVDPRIVDVAPGNIESLLEGIDLVLDGTDNFETRFLLNDACVKRRIPWVMAACVGSYGNVLPVLPGRTACYACWLGDLPPAGSSPTCDTAGVVAPIVGAIAALQCAEAMKILAGRLDAVFEGTQALDVWSASYQAVRAERNPGCPACGRGDYAYLNARATPQAAVLCGRDAVQIGAAPGTNLDLAELERRLAGAGRTSRNPYLLRLEADGAELTIFPDGRTIVKGTQDPARARALVARYVGS